MRKYTEYGMLEEAWEQAREAHNALVMAAAPLTWATDGRLPTAVRIAVEYIRRLEAENAELKTVREEQR